jgi:medium-chain acyl-[acyl-carrier-protein] hydrolase
VFRDWQADLGHSVDVLPVRLRGRESRILEPPLTSVGALVESIAGELLPACTGGPFAFFGYSFGALLAFETARALRKAGVIVDHLVVAALKAPHLPIRRKQIHSLSDAEFAGELRQFRGTPEAVLRNPELMDLVLPSIRADFRAYETYVHQSDAPLECPITAMGGTRDTSVSSDELSAWAEHSSGPFEARMFPGDHFFLNSSRRLLTWTIAEALHSRACVC